MKKPIYPGVPDAQSLRTALEMGYAVTATGLAWPSNDGWKKPSGDSFPMPALVFHSKSQWRPDGCPIKQIA